MKALAALSPEMRALAEEFGLFGLRVMEVAEEIETAVQRAGRIAGQELIDQALERAVFTLTQSASP